MQLLLRTKSALRSIGAVTLLLLLAGCPKRDVTQAPSPASVAVVTALSNAEESEVTPVPSLVRDRIDKEVSRRGLTPTSVTGVHTAFETKRAPEARIAIIVESTDAEGVLLVDAIARYSAQVNGRYRWSVYGSVRLVPDGVPDDTLVREFQIPVHLIYSQQDEDDAVSDAAPIIARHVGQLLETWIAAGQ